MRYSEAVLSAPPGAAAFEAPDVARLSPSTLRLLLAPGPAAPPLEDVAAGLAGAPGALRAVAQALPPARGERLLRLSQRPVPPETARAAGERLVRGLFWPLVYELEPDRWAALAAAERLPEGLLSALPVDGRRVLDVAAGSGRLTLPVAARAAWTVATEPSAPLRERLAHGLGARGAVVAARTQALPFADRAFDVVLCCAAVGPDGPLGGEPAVRELERLGALLALVGPERPEWFEERGYRRLDFPAPDPQAAPEVTDFFGPLHPPRTLLLRPA